MSIISSLFWVTACVTLALIGVIVAVVIVASSKEEQHLINNYEDYD